MTGMLFPFRKKRSKFVFKILIHIVAICILTIILSALDFKIVPRVLGPAYKRWHRQTDDDGIRMIVYSPVNRQYNAKFIADDAKALYEQYKKTNDESVKQHFLNIIDWLVKNKTTINDASIWYNHFPWPDYNMTSPWACSIAQGEIALVLFYAYEITDAPIYMAESMAAVRSFLINVKDGGIRLCEDDSTWWYEEYADRDAEPAQVLNGFMFALLSIHELMSKIDDPLVKMIFENGIRALKKRISEYDAGWWTYYDRKLYLASDSYHQKHIMLAQKFYRITGDKIFSQSANRWQSYHATFWKRFIHNFKIGRLNVSQKAVVIFNLFLSIIIVVAGSLLMLKIKLRKP